MTSELLSMTREKAAAYKRHLQNKESHELKEAFKLISAQVEKAIRVQKVKYYSDLLDTNCLDSRKCWEVINEVRGKKAKDKIETINIDGEDISADKNSNRVAQNFNLFFSNVADNLIANAGLNIESDGNSIQNAIGNVEVNASIVNKAGAILREFSLTTSDIEKAIRSLKNKNNIGDDGISTTIIKELMELFGEILLPIFNKSLKQGVFPDLLKLAIIVPVSKEGDTTKLNNYRPIALLPCISKIFEKCVKEKLLNYLNHIKFISPRQFGFMKKKVDRYSIIHTH